MREKDRLRLDSLYVVNTEQGNWQAATIGDVDLTIITKTIGIEQGRQRKQGWDSYM